MGVKQYTWEPIYIHENQAIYMGIKQYTWESRNKLGN